MITLLGTNAHAAPCCGGASSLPSLITGDDRAQLSSSVASGHVVGDAPSQGTPIFRTSEDTEESLTLALAGAYRVADRVQIGAELPMIRRVRRTERLSAESSGVGDIRLDGAYEFLPEWTYSEWKPHGFVFSQITLPTSPSAYDSNKPFMIDSRGRGFLTTAIGVVLLKNISIWDLMLSTEIHKSYSRSVQDIDGANLEVDPSLGGSALLGLGYSPGGGNWRIGTSISPVYEGPITSTGETQTVSTSQLLWNTTISVGYAVSSDLSSGLSYSDQTLFGPAQNVTLSRTVSFNLQKRWEL